MAPTKSKQNTQPNPRNPAEQAFLDRSREWRRIFAELWGTFLLVTVTAGAAVVDAYSGGKVTPPVAAIAPGLMVMSIIYFMGAVSGAHVNPAVTIAFAVRGNFQWWRVPGYLVAQFPGAIAAAFFLRGMFGIVGISAPQLRASMSAASRRW
jgi:aquaporin Z